MEGLDFSSAGFHAISIAEKCHAAYWVEHHAGKGAAAHLEKTAKESLHKLAEIMGYTLAPLQASEATE